MVAKTENNELKDDSNETVCWVRLTVGDLDSIKPGSKLAKRVLEDALDFTSAWRPAYVNAVERLIINPDLLVFEDAPITENSVNNDEQEGAYVMCWQFIPHDAVIPPGPATNVEIAQTTERLRKVSQLLE